MSSAIPASLQKYESHFAASMQAHLDSALAAQRKSIRSALLQSRWASFCIVCQQALEREKAPWSDIDTSLVMAA
jgi:hypothetical protein